MISLPKLFSSTNPKWPLIVALSILSGVVWTENIWCSIDGALLIVLRYKVKVIWLVSKYAHVRKQKMLEILFSKFEFLN